ncbi:hypothetical protein L5F09_07860 [Aliarcobacter butzleri]|uniref:hypothetical protein n=1 Tax=Aliarcobacter butzleri TaxID=28197 RepID=UPI001EDB5270|nr:hypothetical protein [Aliarcobacter butzleri]MCG3665659.1 hypothetical protein [Aliarcobacter butzleri]MDN5050632.1 hypothetical protein [Aliarcobacter butzleri]MDN5057762.1 hypothetical protein [Aliarcobacter butzleri]
MKLYKINNILFFGDECLGELSEEGKIDSIELTSSEFGNKFLNLRDEDIIDNININIYEGHINYIKKVSNKTIIELSNDYLLCEWNFELTPNDYVDFMNKNNINSLVEDGYVFNFLKKELEGELSIQDCINDFILKINELNTKLVLKNKINQSISFSQEHLSAGISILQYFGKLLQEKYPNEEVSVSIKQEGLKVTMIIETPDGKKEEIEEYLNRYGMVITNQITPQEFASNPIQLIELKQELREAQNKILFQQELLSLKDDTYNNRIKSLEDELNFLRKEFSNILLTNKENIEVLLNSLLTKDKLIRKLSKSIENRNDIETKQLLLELKEKDSKGYVSLKQHIDNAIIGGIVNAPSWIQFTVGILSKVG